MYLPSIAQRDNMVDVNVASRSPRSAVIGALPRATRRCTSRIGDDVGAIALKDRLAGVASAGLCDPVGEQVARVAVLGALGLDGETGEEGGSTAGGRNIRGSALLDRGGGSEGGDGRDDEDGLHGRDRVVQLMLEEVYSRLAGAMQERLDTAFSTCALLLSLYRKTSP
jgi:hypothetical protein